jgi:outer membrane autotransporter protein
MAPSGSNLAATDHRLIVDGDSYISNPDYAAIYTYTEAQDHDLTVELGSGVTIETFDSGLGAVWLRNETSGDIHVDSAATVRSWSGPGITATTNLGGVTIANRGAVTSTNEMGIYADGGYNNSSDVDVWISNDGTVEAYLAGLRAVNYAGQSAIDNAGTVTSETRQGLVVWAADGSASIVNTGSVNAYDDRAIQAWSVGENASIINSGTVTAYDDLTHADVGGGHNGLWAFAESRGDVQITNQVGGIVSAPDDVAVFAEADDGDIEISNAGAISGRVGIDAQTGNDNAITIVNEGTITGLGGAGVILRGATLFNNGTISGSSASVYMAQGGNTIEVNPSSVFDGVVDYNRTAGNTTAFGAGSYHLDAANYDVIDNTIRLNNRRQKVIFNDADTNGSIDVVATSAQADLVSAYTDSVSDVIGSIIALDVARPGGFFDQNDAASFLDDPNKASAGHKAIATLSDGLALDQNGRLLWARGFGGGRNQSETDDTEASQFQHYGLILGVDRQVEQYRLGFFAGAGSVSSKSSSSGNTLDGDTGFGGIYATLPVGDMTLDASLTLGAIDNHSARAVNGSDWAKGDFVGVYASPEVALRKTYALSTDWTVAPSVRLRYVGAYYEGYAESGSLQDLDYDARDTHSLEGRLQVDLAHHFMTSAGGIGLFSLNAAVVDKQNLGAGNAMATLGNTEFSFEESGDRNVVGISLGAGFDLPITARASLYGGIEGALYSNQSRSYTGRIGVKMMF